MSARRSSVDSSPREQRLSSEETGPKPTRSRRLARLAAFEALYAAEVSAVSREEIVDTCNSRRPLAPEAFAFFENLLDGVHETREDVDKIIELHLARGWTLNRLAVTDLVALRIAIFELYHMSGIPPKVSIIEAVTLAKTFGSAESGRFVHGVLGNVFKSSPKVDWTPEQEEQRIEADDGIIAPDVDDEVEIREGTPEHDELVKAGAWILRREDS